MSLIDIVNNSKTDKNTVHSYLGLYQKIMINKKDTVQNVLEIGIAEGGSIKMWSEFFTNAVIHGLDIIHMDNVWSEIKNNNKIVLYTSTDAYDETFFKTEFLNENKRFDVMIDDGPHTLESMLKFIRLYSKLMTDDGILIIEDVQSWDWIKILTNIVPFHLRKFIKVYDLRENKDRYDDIVFTIDKS
jgi:cephalosporin hydroxylase